MTLHVSSSPSKHRLTRPSTSAGRRALLLVAVGIALQPLVAVLVNVAHLSSNVGVLGALGLAAMAAGGVYSGIAVFRRRERSILVIATLGIGVILAIFVIGEFAFPH